MKFSPFQAFFPLCFPYELNSTNSLIVGGWGFLWFGVGFFCVCVRAVCCLWGFFCLFFSFSWRPASSENG